jgi:NAD dependent epimerase/dehydratase family enzyme
LGLGGKIGNGKQYISWIHEDDFTEIVQLAIDREDFEGTIHCTSPVPIKNKGFLKALRESCKVKIGIPNPSFLVKMGAEIIGTEAELLLTGRRVVSKTLREKGYEFKYPKIEEALDHLVK